jgi:hypothetical protein
MKFFPGKKKKPLVMVLLEFFLKVTVSSGLLSPPIYPLLE